MASVPRPVERTEMTKCSRAARAIGHFSCRLIVEVGTKEGLHKLRLSLPLEPLECSLEAGADLWPHCVG